MKPKEQNWQRKPPKTTSQAREPPSGDCGGIDFCALAALLLLIVSVAFGFVDAVIVMLAILKKFRFDRLLQDNNIRRATQVKEGNTTSNDKMSSVEKSTMQCTASSLSSCPMDIWT